MDLTRCINIRYSTIIHSYVNAEKSLKTAHLPSLQPLLELVGSADRLFDRLAGGRVVRGSRYIC